MQRFRRASELALVALLTVPCATTSAQTSTSIRAEVPPPPALGDFGRELLRNSGSLFSMENLQPFLLGSYATAVGLAIDGPVTDYFDRHDFETFSEPGDLVGGPTAVGGVVAALLLGSRFTDNQRFRSYTYALAQGWVINKALVVGLKAAVPRERPDGRNENAFPSGHATSAFMIAAMTERYYGWKATTAAYSWAFYVAFSRLEGGDHHLSDLAFGATLGTIIGRTISDRMLRRGQTELSLMPLPVTRGAGLMVHLRF